MTKEYIVKQLMMIPGNRYDYDVLMECSIWSLWVQLTHYEEVA